MKQLIRGVLCFVAVAFVSPSASRAAPPGLSHAPGLAGSLCHPINSVPTTISAGGVYCLSRDLSTSISGATDAAILIEADDVVVDLKQHVLDGSPAGLSTMSTGIRATNRNDVTVRNGTVRGFLTGIGLIDTSASQDSSGGHLVRGMKVEGNTASGIVVTGRGTRVSGNMVLDTGGSTTGASYDMAGIFSGGPGGRVLNNDVIGVSNNTSGVTSGIEFSGEFSSSVAADNRISHISSPGGGPLLAGIWLETPGSSTGVVMAGNIITNPATGSTTSYGIRGINGQPNNVCRDNTIFGFDTGISNCNYSAGNETYP